MSRITIIAPEGVEIKIQRETMEGAESLPELWVIDTAGCSDAEFWRNVSICADHYSDRFYGFDSAFKAWQEDDYTGRIYRISPQNEITDVTPVRLTGYALMHEKEQQPKKCSKCQGSGAETDHHGTPFKECPECKKHKQTERYREYLSNIV